MGFNTLTTEHEKDVDSILEEQKASLRAEISALGKTLEDMDAVAKNHASLTLEFGTLEEDIISKKTELESLKAQIAVLSVEAEDKTKLKAEIDELTAQKKAMEENITYLQSVGRVIQAEVENFRSGKEAVIKQMQEKTDAISMELFNAETKKKDLALAFQALADSVK